MGPRGFPVLALTLAQVEAAYLLMHKIEVKLCKVRMRAYRKHAAGVFALVLLRWRARAAVE